MVEEVLMPAGVHVAYLRPFYLAYSGPHKTHLALQRVWPEIARRLLWGDAPPAPFSLGALENINTFFFAQKPFDYRFQASASDPSPDWDVTFLGLRGLQMSYVRMSYLRASNCTCDCQTGISHYRAFEGRTVTLGCGQSGPYPFWWSVCLSVRPCLRQRRRIKTFAFCVLLLRGQIPVPSDTSGIVAENGEAMGNAAAACSEQMFHQRTNVKPQYSQVS
jgi:hypothetical protein